MERASLRKILVAAAMHDDAGFRAASTLLKVKAKAGVMIVNGASRKAGGDVDWDAIRAAEGGWGPAYEWAAQEHDSVCVVPVDGVDGLSRGVFSMAQAALRQGKPVLAFRGGKLEKVKDARVVDAREYKGVYGRFTREEA